MIHPSLIRVFIWKKWLTSFFTSCGCIFVLLSVVILTGNLLRSSITPREALYHYILFAPDMLSKIFPPAYLLASLFSLQKMRENRELVALLAAGFSQTKIIIAIVQIATAATIIQFLNTSYLEPYCRGLLKKVITNSEVKFKETKRVGLPTISIKGGEMWYRSNQYFVSYSAYDRNLIALIKPSFFYFDSHNRNTKIVYADRATWKTDQIWVLSNAKEVKHIQGASFPKLHSTEESLIELEEKPADFDLVDDDLNTLTLPSLYQFVSQIKKSGITSGKYELFLFEKIFNNITCIFFAIIPLSILFSPNQRNASFIKNISFALLFTTGAWLFHSIILTLGESGEIPPLLAISIIPALCLFYFATIFALKSKKPY